MRSVHLQFRQGVSASIALDDALTVLDVAYSGFEEPDSLRQAVGRAPLIEGRSRLGGVELLNVNAFPFDSIPGVCDHGPAGHRIDEDVTVHLAEGRGAACAWSSRLDALTVWWLGSDDSPGGQQSCTFSFQDTSVTVPTTTMRSFRSATSDELGEPVMHVAAISRADLERTAPQARELFVEVSSPGPTIEATVILGDQPRVRGFRVEHFECAPELKAAVRDLPWQTVSEVDPEAPQFCVNNHPSPKISPEDPEPGDGSPDGPEEEPEGGDEEPEGLSADGRWVDDFVAVRVSRSGQVNALLRAGEPACLAGTSPTINCLTFYWLSRSQEWENGEVAVELDEERLPHRCQRQRFRRELTDVASLDIQVNSVQVPLAAVATAAGRSDLVPGATELLGSPVD